MKESCTHSDKRMASRIVPAEKEGRGRLLHGRGRVLHKIGLFVDYYAGLNPMNWKKRKGGYLRFRKIFTLSISVTYSNPDSIRFWASLTLAAVLLTYSSSGALSSCV